MGNPRETTMWAWQEKFDTCLRVAYMNYLRKELAKSEFVDAGGLDNYWEWCMANQPKAK